MRAHIPGVDAAPRSDLPVLLPSKVRERAPGRPGDLAFSRWVGSAAPWKMVLVLAFIVAWPLAAAAQSRYTTWQAFDALWRWLPFLVVEGLRDERPHQLPRHGDRHRGRRGAGALADLAVSRRAPDRVGPHPGVPQLAVARAAVHRDADVPVPDRSRLDRRLHPRLDQGRVRALVAGHGQPLRGGARRSAIGAHGAVGGGRVACVLAPPDPVANRACHSASSG